MARRLYAERCPPSATVAFSLENGRVCLTNNCAERSVRGAALGRRSWLFAGSERGDHRAAFMYSLMSRPTYVFSIDHVARMIDESLELIEVVSWNSDDIDCGEMIHIFNGTDESLTTFTDRGVECLQEFLADIRTWDGGIRQFLIDEHVDPDVIKRIMAHEKKG